ncbi:MAG TPA: CAP domain-containing protein [Anaerolineales bacterium]|nr:CAP domain-containing protein [Anaerolineales bacterium]
MKRLLRGNQYFPKLPFPASHPLPKLAVFCSCLLFVFLISISFTPGRAKTDSAYDLIASVNQLREANGLPAYRINGSLMAAAQSHSEYQASIGTITHTGAGGSSAKSRAIAAGFGDGATVYVSENIAGGTNMSYQQAVQMWQGDSLHLNTMLGGSYTDAGAGVAYAGDRVYFTLDVGYVAGAPGSGAPVISSSSQPPAATSIPFQPLVTSTPAPDGSVTHKVLSGQTLWSISAIYQVSLPEILALNGFNNSTLIFPGDEILIRSASVTATSGATQTDQPSTPTPTTRPTRTPVYTPQPQVTEVAMQLEQGANISSLNQETGASLKDPALYLIAALVLGGSALMVIGNLLKRQSSSQGEE